jgi:MtN3 and saliva related transmembrane protein
MSTELIGILASVFTSVAWLPQLIKIFREKKAHGISPFMLVSLLIGLSLWSLYGFLKADLIIIIANMFALLVNILVVLAGLWYKKHPHTAK